MDKIADILAEVELSDRDASALREAMAEYARTYHRSLRGLLRVPGFRKLWDAIDESAASSLRTAPLFRNEDARF